MIIRSGTYRGGRYQTPGVVQANLILNLDAGNPASYPGSGSTWTDTESGLVYTLANSPAYDAGNGGSILFDPALSQYAQGPSFASTFSNWTVEAWLYHDTTNMGSGSPCIVTEMYFGNPLNFTLGNTEDSFPYLQSGSFNGGWASTYSGQVTLITGNWYQVTGTWDGTTVRLYVNGVLVNSRAWPGFNSVRGGNGIRLMSRWDNYQYWGGKLSIVRIYNADIGTSGVSQNFNANRSRFGI
jgi:hypothetical protein